MRRLLYICSDFGIRPDGTKGASIHLRAITRALADLGHDVSVLSPHKGPSALGHPATRLLPPGCPEVSSTTRLLKSWLQARDYDQAVARELRGLMYNGWVEQPALAAARTFDPHAVIERLSLCGHVGMDLADALEVPLVLEVNALLTTESKQFRGLALQDLAETIEQRVLRRADAIIAVSQPLAEQIEQVGIDASKIRVVPNGVDLDAFSCLPNRATCQAAIGMADAFVFGFCGSLKVWHGVDVLLDAFARVANSVPRARLLVVGSGPEEERVQHRADDLGLEDRVVFTGAVPHEDVPMYLRAMNVGVAPFRALPSFYFSPIKLFEYMAAESCVVASNLGQISEVIEHDVTGQLCRADDPDALAETLRRCAADPDHCAAIGRQGAQRVAQHYTWADTARATMAIVDRCHAPSSRETVS